MPEAYNYAEETFYNLMENVVNADVDLEVPGFITKRPHVFLGVTFYDGITPANPTAGTYSLYVETVNNPGVFQEVPQAQSVSATASLSTHSVAANITRVRVSSDSISGADGFFLKVTSNAG